jgi:hypothetical protein
LKIASLCNYMFLSATLKVLETFKETIFWKPFQLFRCILSNVSSVTKAPSIHCWYQSTEQVKISWCQARSIKDAPVLSHCSFLRNTWPQPTGVLEHCQEGEINCWVFFFRVFLLTASVRRRRMSMYVFYSQVLYQRISVNYASEFRDIFEANTCKICCLMKAFHRFVRTEKLKF